MRRVYFLFRKLVLILDAAKGNDLMLKITTVDTVVLVVLAVVGCLE
jgi:hypothetical protein